jgi:AcrR family transcriptional regulator
VSPTTAEPVRPGRPPLRSVARPRQARSEETLYRLLDAAEALIEERGLADTSVPAIARRAGSSVGGFYGRFRDKNQLLRTLEERFFERLTNRLEEMARPERWEGASIAVIVRPWVRELVGTFRERRALIRVFLFRAAQDPGFMEEALRFRRRVSARLVGLLLTRRAEIRHPDPELAIDLGVQLAFGVMQQAVMFGEIRVGDRRLADWELVRELTHNVLAHLGIPEDAGERSAGAEYRRQP